MPLDAVNVITESYDISGVWVLGKNSIWMTSWPVYVEQGCGHTGLLTLKILCRDQSEDDAQRPNPQKIRVHLKVQFRVDLSETSSGDFPVSLSQVRIRVVGTPFYLPVFSSVAMRQGSLQISKQCSSSISSLI